MELSIEPDTVAVGDLDMTVSIRSARSGYLMLLQHGTDGKEDIVFPNALDKDNCIEAESLSSCHVKAGNGKLHPLPEKAACWPW